MKQWLLEFALRQKQKKMRVSPDFKVETYLEKIVEYFDAAKAGD